MRTQTNDFDIPYHLRAVRLRWAAFAVTLEEDELAWVEAMVESPSSSSHSKNMARLLLCLHQREEISKLCMDLHISRRKLRDLADRMATKEGRRRLLLQPLPSRGRPPRMG